MQDYFFLDGGAYGDAAMNEISRKCAAMLVPGTYTDEQKRKLDKVAKKYGCAVRWVKVGYDDENEDD